MPESVLVTGRNRLYHGGQCLLPKRDEAAGGSASSIYAPDERPSPFGSYCLGGSLGWGFPKGEGAAGGYGIPCAVLPTAACDLSSSLLTGWIVRFWAHITALPLRAIRGLIRFAKCLSCLRVQYAASKRRERSLYRARLLSSGVLRLPLSCKVQSYRTLRDGVGLVSMTLLE